MENVYCMEIQLRYGCKLTLPCNWHRFLVNFDRDSVVTIGMVLLNADVATVNNMVHVTKNTVTTTLV